MPLGGKLRTWDDDTAKKSPKESGAYELLCNGTVVYIGSSSVSVQERLCSHRKAKRFSKVTHFRYRIVEWEEDAIRLEAKLCKAFKKVNGDKPRLQKRKPINRDIFDW